MPQAQVELDKTIIRAGVTGRVEQFALQVGDIVNPVMRSAGILIPESAGRRALIAGFGQIEAQVMRIGMVAEVTCVSKPWKIIPMVVTGVQDYIAAGQFRGGEQLIDVQSVPRPGTILTILEPLYEDGLDGVTPGSSCIANAYTSNHELLASKDIGVFRSIGLHAVDAVGIVHAALLRAARAADRPGRCWRRSRSACWPAPCWWPTTCATSTPTPLAERSRWPCGSAPARTRLLYQACVAGALAGVAAIGAARPPALVALAAVPLALGPVRLVAAAPRRPGPHRRTGRHRPPPTGDLRPPGGRPVGVVSGGVSRRDGLEPARASGAPGPGAAAGAARRAVRSGRRRWSRARRGGGSSRRCRDIPAIPAGARRPVREAVVRGLAGAGPDAVPVNALVPAVDADTAAGWPPRRSPPGSRP